MAYSLILPYTYIVQEEEGLKISFTITDRDQWVHYIIPLSDTTLENFVNDMENICG